MFDHAGRKGEAAKKANPKAKQKRGRKRANIDNEQTTTGRFTSCLALCLFGFACFLFRWICSHNEKPLCFLMSFNSLAACMLPIFAKAQCCLELFGSCCRRLSPHGVGVVLIPLRHCWRDAFFCVCVGSGSSCHDWASHCSVLFWSLDALFVLRLPPPPWTPNAAALQVGFCMSSEFSIISE